MARLIYFLCILLLFGCQTDISSKDQVVKGNSDLKTSDGILDLSQFSQEQQKVEREQAAKRREELKAGRVVLETTHKEKIKRQSVNLAVFARSVSNKLGEKIYYRNFLKIYFFLQYLVQQRQLFQNPYDLLELLHDLYSSFL